MYKEKLVPNKEYFKSKDLNNMFDSLTGVLNRDAVHDYASFLISENRPFSLSMIDIDNFKYINDNYGHLMGDQALREVAQKIHDIIGDSGTIGRFGGDEFIIVFEGITDYEEVWNICHKLNEELSTTTFCGDTRLPITLTAGLSRFPLDATDIDDLVETTDKALYRGKMKGRNCFIIYLPEKHKNINLKSEKDKMFSSMFLHAKVFELLTSGKTLANSINDFMKYFCSYLMIDRICIETNGEMKYIAIHPLGTTDGYEYIDQKILTSCFSNIGLFYVNNIETLSQVGRDDFRKTLEKQNVKSMLCCDISIHGKSYGTLRAETTNSGRIWQANEMDLLLTASKVIAMLLYFSNDTL